MAAYSVFTPTELQELLGIAKEAAAQAATKIGENIDARAAQPLRIETKMSSVDLVTQCDKECEELVYGILTEKCAAWKKKRPVGSASATSFKDFDFLGEESAKDKQLTDTPTWVVDPIDGTTAFVHGGFDCGVSIGLAVAQQPSLGVMHLPRMGEVFSAVVGQGAFVDRYSVSPCGKKVKHQRLHLSGSQNDTVGHALVCTHFSYNRAPSAVEALLHVNRALVMQHRVHALRSYGAAAMDICSVALGRLDMYAEALIQAWDMCAGVIIAREAGCLVMSLDAPGSAAAPHMLQAYSVIQAKRVAASKSGDLAVAQAAATEALPFEREQYNVMRKSLVVASGPTLAKMMLDLMGEVQYRHLVLNAKM